MKKIYLFIGFFLGFAFTTHAAYIEKFPITVTQPDSTVVHCFVSGDEFYNWVHDSNGYTLIRDPQTGFVVYADLLNDTLVSTGYIVGSIDPASIGLQPGIIISETTREQMRNNFLNNIRKPSKTRGAPTISNAGQNNGSINNIVIYIRFSDDTTEFPAKANTYNDLFNKDTVNCSSMYRYFKEASYGKTLIETSFYPYVYGDTIISYRDIYPRSYYQPNTISPNGYQGSDEGPDRTAREHQLLVRAIKAVRNQISPSLNLDFDNDGYVDNICFIIKGSPGAWASLLWPHQWALYTDTVTINGRYVWDYNFQIETHLDGQGSSVLCHEMFHTLGAPDLYRYNNKTIEPVDKWDLMAINATPPQSMTAYMKYKYGGWLDSIPEIRQGGTYTLHDVWSDTNNAYKIASPNSTTEFFIVEYRRTNVYWDSNLPGSGLIIYRVNTNANGNANGPPDEIYIFRPGATTNSTKGTIANAYFSDQAGRIVFNNVTNPPCFLSNNSSGGIRIRNIGASGGNTMSFEVVMPNEDTLVAKWNNYPNGSHSAVFLATNGSAANDNIATLTRDSLGTDYTVNNDDVAASTGWQNATTNEKYWETSFSTLGFKNLQLISKQRGSDKGPKDFKIQYRVDTASSWTDVPNGTIVVANDNYITGVKNYLPLPAAISNKTKVFLRWLCTSTVSIDNGVVDSSGVNCLDISVFGKPTLYYTITTATDVNGSISPFGKVLVIAGDTQRFDFTPNIGYHINSVYVDNVYNTLAIANGYYIFNNVTVNHAIRVGFAINTFVIAATAGTGGAPAGNKTPSYGSNSTFYFTPSTGYHIDSVFVDGIYDSAAVADGFYIFTNITENHSIHVTFAIDTFTITAIAGTDGTISPFGDTVVVYGDSLTYNFTPNTGYHIDSVFVDSIYDENAVTEGYYIFNNIAKNHSICVTFAIDTFTITAIAGTDGTISPFGDTAVVYGDSLTYNFTPNTGYHIDSVFVDSTYDENAVTNGYYIFNNIIENHSICVTFAIDIFTITAIAGSDGTIAPEGVIYVNYNEDSPTFTFVPDACYEIDQILINGINEPDSAANGSYTFTNVTANQIILATFKQIIDTIWASASNGGIVVPSGMQTVKCGNDTLEFCFYPDEGRMIERVLIDDVEDSMAKINRCYTFANSDENHTVFVIFQWDDIKESATQQIKIFPNPTTGQLRIVINNEQLTMNNVEIYSVVGQKAPFNSPSMGDYSPFEGGRGMSEIVLDISHLPAGMYFLKVGNKVMRFVKE